MSRSERVIVWTGRFSDEQVAVFVLAAYVGSIGALAFLAWLVMR